MWGGWASGRPWSLRIWVQPMCRSLPETSCYLAVTLDSKRRGAHILHSHGPIAANRDGSCLCQRERHLDPDHCHHRHHHNSTGTARRSGLGRAREQGAAKTVNGDHPAGNLPTGPLHFAVVASSTVIPLTTTRCRRDGNGR